MAWDNKDRHGYFPVFQQKGYLLAHFGVYTIPMVRSLTRTLILISQK